MAATTKIHDKGMAGSGDASSSTTGLDRFVLGVSQVGIGMGVMIAGLVGVWALAAFLSAMAKSGGIMELVRGWLTAITGV